MRFEVAVGAKHLLFLIVLAGVAVGISYAGAFVNPGTGVGHIATDVGPGTMTGPIEVSGGLSADNLGVSGITTFKGVAYTWPSSMGSSSQVLSIQDAGTGQLAWMNYVDSDWVIVGNDMYSGVSGNVGIGTTTPKGKLDVSGGISIGSYAGVNAPPSSGVIISGDVGIGTANPQYKLDVSGQLRASKFYDDDTSYYADLNTGGRLGGDWIWHDGTTYDMYFGAIATDWMVLGFNSPITSSNYALSGDYATTLLNAPTGSNIQFRIGNVQKVTITSDGNVVIGAGDPGSFKLRIVGGPLQVDTSGESQFKSGNTYIHLKAIEGAGSSGYGEIGAYRSGEGWKNLILNAGGGYIGIGTTTPSEKLEVVGNIKATGFCIGAEPCIYSWPAGGGGITQLNQGNGIILSPNPITATGTISANTGYLQRRVTGTCSDTQAVGAINADGSVVCVDTGAVGYTTYENQCVASGYSYCTACCSVGESLTTISIGCYDYYGYNDGGAPCGRCVAGPAGGSLTIECKHWY